MLLFMQASLHQTKKLLGKINIRSKNLGKIILDMTTVNLNVCNELAKGIYNVF